MRDLAAPLRAGDQQLAERGQPADDVLGQLGAVHPDDQPGPAGGLGQRRGPFPYVRLGGPAGQLGGVHPQRVHAHGGQVAAVADLPGGAVHRRAENFLWAVRCHLHVISGRAEDRLTFDVQTEIAERMRFADRPGKSKVERFMHFYFLQAKMVGDLTLYSEGHPELLGIFKRYGIELRRDTNAPSAKP